jgi:hypothetical protein
MTPDSLFRSLGSSGLKNSGGFIREEYLPQLSGNQAARQFREMGDNSAAVNGILFAITSLLRKVKWRTEPADDTPQAQEMADYVESLRHDMHGTWEDMVSEALSMFQYGFAPCEVTYKWRDGYQPEGSETPTSDYSDGLIGWESIRLLGQDTIQRWYFDKRGRMIGVFQQPFTGPGVSISGQKLLNFRASPYKDNPEGRSILRGAYRSYFMTKRFEEMESIMFERMAGLPTLYMPSEILNKAVGVDGQPADPVAVATVQAYRNLVANVRIDNWMGVVLPSDVYMDSTGKPTNVRKYEFTLLTPQGGGRTGMDADKQITRNNLLIMQSVLADFLALGHEVRGTQAAAFTKVDLFLDALDAALSAVAAVFNRLGLPRLWYLNAFDPELQPTYQPDLAQRIDIDTLSAFALRMAQAGMPLFPDADTEDFFRDAAGMPLRPEDGTIPLDISDPDLIDEGSPIGAQTRAPGGAGGAAGDTGGGDLPPKIQKSLRSQGRLLQQRMLQRAKDRNRKRGVAA